MKGSSSPARSFHARGSTDFNDDKIRMSTDSRKRVKECEGSGVSEPAEVASRSALAADPVDQAFRDRVATKEALDPSTIGIAERRGGADPFGVRYPSIDESHSVVGRNAQSSAARESGAEHDGVETFAVGGYRPRHVAVVEWRRHWRDEVDRAIVSSFDEAAARHVDDDRPQLGHARSSQADATSPSSTANLPFSSSPGSNSPAG